MQRAHRIRRHFSWFIASLLALVPCAIIPTASARSYSNDTISCGLRAGVSLDISQLRNCTNGPGVDVNPGDANHSNTTGETSARYVALGDSVAAGLGLPSTANENDGRCGRSRQSYAYRVAASTGLSLEHIACSGATAGDLVTKQAVDGPNIPAQLDQAFADGTPQLITVTAGANDAHWSDFIRACYVTDCSNTASTVVANAYLQALRLKLNYALGSIDTRRQGQPSQVLLTGYYNPVSTSCNGILPQVSSRELSWIGAETSKLNSVIREAATNHGSFVRYVPLSFAGHDICSSSPWVQGLDDAAPFHPTAIGQAQIARAIIESYTTN